MTCELLHSAPQTLRTPRLEMRRLTPEDREPMQEMLRSELIRKTYMIPDLPTQEAADRLFFSFQQKSASPDYFIFGAWRDGRMVGFLNNTSISGDVIELGYVVHPAFHNRGYATEMLRASIEALFGLGFKTVRAGFFEGNSASRRVMEKSGMQPTGETEQIEYRGESRRCILYEIRR